MSQQKQNLLYVLDSFSKRDVKRWRQQYQAISAYCWDHYSYFAHQRSRMADALKTSLIGNCISYEFSNWRRVVDNKFNHEPLSARGSILNEAGGRFNIGDIDQIKFPMPTSFITRAKQLGISAMLPVHSAKELLSTFFRDDWRIMPMQFDIPSNPQILGQLAHAAGIEAILYPSVKTQKKCLVIYPENFRSSKAYIEIEGDSPKGVIHNRIDNNTFNNFI